MCTGQDDDDWSEVRERWPEHYAEAQRIDEYARREFNLSLFAAGAERPCCGECFL